MLADTKLLRRCMPCERLVQRRVLNAEGMFQWAAQYAGRHRLINL